MGATTLVGTVPDIPPAVQKRLLNDPLVPCPDAQPPTRYDVDDFAGWSASLAEDGYAVIRDVANAAEVREAGELFWEWVSQAEPAVSRTAPETWVHIPCERTNGIIFSRGIGQSSFAWYVRALPKVRKAFSQLWNVSEDKLITSFDGANVFRPFLAPAGAPDLVTRGGWWHCDQSGHNPGLQCVQGLVAITAATPATGGLVVLPGSHVHHAELAQRYPHVTHDFVGIDAADPILGAVAGGIAAPATLVQCSAGDLVLWDSRVVHCNSPALVRAAEQGEPRLLRLASYVCMTPRAWADETTLAMRHMAVDQLATSTHWPHRFRVTSCAQVDESAEGRITQLSGVQMSLV